MNNLTQQEDSKNNVVIIDIPNKQLGPKNKRNSKHSSANLSKDNIDNKSTISKTSKTSKTASHLSSTSSTTNLLLLKIPTCCGTLELTPIKTGSLVGTASTIFAFFLLAGIIIATFILQQQNDLKVIVDRGDIKHLRDTLTHTTFLAIYAPDNFTSNLYIQMYNATYTQYLTTLFRLMDSFPEGFKSGWMTGGNLNVNGTPVSIYEQLALAQVARGNRQEALKVLLTTDYLYAYNNFTINMDNVLSLVLSKGEQHEKNMLAITLIGLIVIAIALVFLLPIMIGIFGLAINRDHIHLKKLKQANAIMLMDTMKDDKLRELFKKQCEEEHSMENFTFLEKVTLYKRLCEESYEVQEKLYGSENDTSSSTNSAEMSTANVTNNNSNNSSVTKNNAAIDNNGGGDNMNRQSTAVTTNNKKQEKLEKELKEIEKKKYEMAFDIYTDFLDLNGGNAVNITKAFIEEVKIQLDYFNTGHNEVLAEALFDRATREISIVMLDTHQRFKSSIAFQKQMKITKLVNNKKKKVNNSH